MGRGRDGGGGRVRGEAKGRVRQEFVASPCEFVAEDTSQHT